jgi:hypothetical protein
MPSSLYMETTLWLFVELLFDRSSHSCILRRQVVVQHYTVSVCDVSVTLYSLLPAAEEIESTASVSGEAARSQDHVVLAKHLAQSSR